MEASVIHQDGKRGGSQDLPWKSHQLERKSWFDQKKRDKIQTRRHDKVVSLFFVFYTIGEYILNSFVFVMVVM